MRAESTNDYAPQRIDGGESRSNPKAPQSNGTGSTQGKIVSPLEKLLNFRKAMIQFGLSGKDFDAARDVIKTKFENEGKDVWLHVCNEMKKELTLKLKEIGES